MNNQHHNHSNESVQKKDLLLFELAKSGLIDEMRKLITQGANPHLLDQHGISAINYALSSARKTLSAPEALRLIMNLVYLTNNTARDPKHADSH